MEFVVVAIFCFTIGVMVGMRIGPSQERRDSLYYEGLRDGMQIQRKL